MARTVINVTGDAELKRKFAQMTALARSHALALAAQAGGEVIRTEASRNAPYKSGTLRRSIHTEVLMTGTGRANCNIGTNLVYARIQEYGGVIKATRAPYLVFQVNGEWVSVKQVTIPARPYLRPAFDMMRPQAVATVGAVFRELVIGPAVMT